MNRSSDQGVYIAKSADESSDLISDNKPAPLTFLQI